MFKRVVIFGLLLLLAGSLACELLLQPSSNPVVTDAGDDFVVAVDTPFELSATAAGGTKPYIFRWTLEQKPSAAEFELDGEQMASTLGIEAVADEGEYVFRVRVTDAIGQIDTDFVTVSVGGDLDVTATASAPLAVIDEPILLDVTIDESTNGAESKTFSWEVASGQAQLNEPTSRNPVATIQGEETVTFKVSTTATFADETRFGVGEVVVVGIRDASPQVVIENTGGVEGDIVFELRTAVAPKTCANFLRYVDEGFFDGIIWHRVVENFVIQGGAYERPAEVAVRREGVRDPVESEAENGYSNIRGAVAMALAGTDADSGTNQFFVSLKDNSSLDDGTPPFTVFARVVDGMDVVDEIAAVDVVDESVLQDIPEVDIVMNSVHRLDEEIATDPDEPDYDPDNPDPGTNGVEVVASADDPLRIVGESTQLHAVVTEPPAGITYEWQVVAGSATFDNATSTDPTVTIASAETIQFRVSVLDGEGEELGSADAFVVGVSDATPEVVIVNEGEVDGTIVLELLTDDAPITCANFLRYVDSGFYEDLVWHRVEVDVAIRTGLYFRGEIRLEGRWDDVRDPIPSEADNGLSNLRGNVAMVTIGTDPDSAESQFFINVGDNPSFDSGPPRTVFARVIEGMGVVDEITTVEVGNAVVEEDGTPRGLSFVPQGEGIAMVSVTRR